MECKRRDDTFYSLAIFPVLYATQKCKVIKIWRGESLASVPAIPYLPILLGTKNLIELKMQSNKANLLLMLYTFRCETQNARSQNAANSTTSKASLIYLNNWNLQTSWNRGQTTVNLGMLARIGKTHEQFFFWRKTRDAVEFITQKPYFSVQPFPSITRLVIKPD